MLSWFQLIDLSTKAMTKACHSFLISKLVRHSHQINLSCAIEDSNDCEVTYSCRNKLWRGVQTLYSSKMYHVLPFWFIIIVLIIMKATSPIYLGWLSKFLLFHSILSKNRTLHYLTTHHISLFAPSNQFWRPTSYSCSLYMHPLIFVVGAVSVLLHTYPNHLKHHSLILIYCRYS